MKLWPLLLAPVAALVLSGCTGGSVSTPPQSIALTTVDAQVPATAQVNVPMTFTATVQLTTTAQTFVRFATARGASPYTITALGQDPGGGLYQTRTEQHQGTITFTSPGTYNVDFNPSTPPISRKVTVQ